MDLREVLWVVTTLSAIIDLVIGEPFGRSRHRKIQPKFLPTPTNITVHRGEMAVLKCHILNVGTKMVVWRRKISDVPLTIGSDTFTQDEPTISIEVHEISEEKSQWDLIIKDVQPRHTGMYLCQVTASKLYTHYVTLHVLNESVPVEPDLQITGNTYVDQGEQILLTCNATGASRPPLDVDWFFKGERIVKSKPLWSERTRFLRRKAGRSFLSTLIIDRSTMNYSGNYVCRSSDLKMNSIFVNVLSVVKPNVSRRDYENLSQPEAGNSVSSAATNSILHRVFLTYTLTICTTLCLSLHVTCRNFSGGQLTNFYRVNFFRRFTDFRS